MSKTTKIICDVCGKDITHEWRYDFKEHILSSVYKNHLCNDCFKKLRKFIKEKGM